MRFSIDEGSLAVRYGGELVPWEVFDVRVVEPRDAPARHTFTVEIEDHLFVQVSWAGDVPGDESAAQLVWAEASYALGMFLIDRAGGWGKHAGLRSTPGERPVRYVPRLLPAPAVYAWIAGGLPVSGGLLRAEG